MATRLPHSSTATRLLVILSLLLAACGGGDDASDDTATMSGQEDTSSNGGSTEPTPAEEEDDSDDAAPSETGATITMGGETYRFALGDSSSCEPNMFDGVFLHALLDRVDDSGQAVAIDDPDLPEGHEHVQIAVGTEEGVGQKIISGYFGGAQWEAGEDGNEESSIDSISKEGNRAEGSATFLNLQTGEIVEGTFDVTCAGD